MNYLVVAAALTGLLTTAADAQSAACRGDATQEQTQAQEQVARKKKAAPKAGKVDISPMTPADKEILDRAHTRTLLENIEGQLRKPR